MHEEEDHFEVLGVVPVREELGVFVMQVTDLRVCAELRLIDDALDGHENVCLTKADLASGRDADQLTLVTKRDRVATRWPKNALLVAPSIEADILLFLLDLSSLFPIDLEFVLVAEPSLPLNVLHMCWCICRLIAII